MILQTLHLTCVAFPLAPTIDSAQGNLTTHDVLIHKFSSSFCYWLGL